MPHDTLRRTVIQSRHIPLPPPHHFTADKSNPIFGQPFFRSFNKRNGGGDKEMCNAIPFRLEEISLILERKKNGKFMENFDLVKLIIYIYPRFIINNDIEMGDK